MRSGVINIYKEKGYTSFDVVAKLRGILKERKIGHTGTLDPDAEGVLPVCIGKATKLCGMLTDKDKEYETVLLLGRTTDTQDISGQTLREAQVTVSEEEARKAILSFVGEYDQLTPMYSARKVNGQKLCDLARKGQEVERSRHRITIYAIDILEIALPRVRMRVHCSKGTYIRTLCQDIGEKLSCGGCMEALLRTRVERFCLTDAVKLSEVERLAREGAAETVLLPVDEMFAELPALFVCPEGEKQALNGNPLREDLLKEALPAAGEDGEYLRVRIYTKSGIFVGIYEYRRDRKLYGPVKLFLE